MSQTPGAAVTRAHRIEDDRGKEMVKIVADELLHLHISGAHKGEVIDDLTGVVLFLTHDL